VFNFFKLISLFAVFMLSCGSIPANDINKKIEQVDSVLYDNADFFLSQKQRMFEPVVKLELEHHIDSFLGMKLEQPLIIKASSATGFAFKYNRKTGKTYILTNDHFCSATFELPSQIIVRTNSMMSEKRTSNTAHLATIEHTDFNYDLCVLSIDEKLTTVKFDHFERDLRPMDKLTVIGGPSGVFPVITDTYFCEYIPRFAGALGNMNKFGQPFIMISQITLPGHSGSPVFNHEGKAVGIIFAGSQTSNGTPIYSGLAIGLRDIRIFLKSPQLEHI